MFFLFWLVVMCLLSSLEEIYFCVQLLADYVWESEEDKTGFLSVGADSFYLLCVQKQPMPFSIVQNSNKNLKYDKWE